ncbi:MAG TPA: hypothetical protein VIJ87_02235, partial [Pyrinomonadaceae bacterium]
KMKTQNSSISVFVTLALWLGLILGCSNLHKAMNEKRAEREGPGITISAEDLSNAYHANEADADKLYQGKLVIVRGTVGTVSIPAGGVGRPAIVLMDGNQKPIVNCFGFAVDARDAIEKLKTGQKVTVKGKCMGKVATDEPSLEDCVLQ